MNDYFKKNLFKIVIIVLIIILYLLIAFLIVKVLDKKAMQKVDDTHDTISINIQEEAEEAEEVEEYIYVDIKGSVKKPNVYKLIKGSRTIDAINSAGGLSKNANTRFINLSKVLNDGDVIVIYSNDEIKKAKKNNTIYVETPCICEEIKNDACYQENNENTSSGLININTANIDELMTLSGIGESKAKAIIEYRTQNGNFNSVEEIMNVSGISETIFSKIKTNITI